MSTTDTILTLGAVAAAGIAVYELVGIGRGVASGVGQTLGDIGSGIAQTPKNTERTVRRNFNRNFNRNVNRTTQGLGGWWNNFWRSDRQFSRKAIGDPFALFQDAFTSIAGNPIPIAQRIIDAGQPPKKKPVPSFRIKNPEAPNLTAQRYRSMSQPAPAPGNPTPPPPKSIKKTNPLAYSKLLAGRIR